MFIVVMIIVYAITFKNDLNKDDFEAAQPFLTLLGVLGILMLLFKG